MAEKFTNIIGVPFKKYVKDQILIRAQTAGAYQRSEDQIKFLGNKNCWVRLVSFVDVESEGELYINGVKVPKGPELSKNWALMGGAISYNSSRTPEMKYGISEGFTDLTNWQGTYGAGGTNQFGYKPMPGIISANVSHAGKNGSLRQGEIKIRANNKAQLDIIDTLYFRLGYSCLLEWGHSTYLDNNGIFQPNGESPLDIFYNPKLDTKERISKAINEKRFNSCGNYDGLYATIYNYDWTQTQDGGYDCTLKIIGLGSIIDSLKINQAFSQPGGAKTTTTQSPNNSAQNKASQPPLSADVLEDVDSPNSTPKQTKELLYYYQKQESDYRATAKDGALFQNTVTGINIKVNSFNINKKLISDTNTLNIGLDFEITTEGTLKPIQIIPSIQSFIDNIIKLFQNAQGQIANDKTRNSILIKQIDYTSDLNKIFKSDSEAELDEENISLNILTINIVNSKTNNVPSNATPSVPAASTSIDQTTLSKTVVSNLQKFLTDVRDSITQTDTGIVDRTKEIEEFLSTGALDPIRKKSNLNIAKSSTELKAFNEEEELYTYIHKGFNSEVLSGELKDYTLVSDVNFEDLFKVYVSGITDISTEVTSKFIYVKLGLLLYYLNNSSLLYESKKGSSINRPFVYIDFNPETNFCLATKTQYSVDPGICYIPINSSIDNYKRLFPPGVYEKISQDVRNFNPSNDIISNLINTDFTDGNSIEEYRGKIMNMGINLDYLINLVQNQSNNNPDTDVLLRPFVETLLEDINKCLGNINAFRVGIYDDAGTVRIYDDHILQPPSNQETLTKNNSTKTELIPSGIPILGKNSIVRSVSLKTDVSSKIGNTLMISAAAGKFGELNTDASGIAVLNNDPNAKLIDRIMRNKNISSDNKEEKVEVAEKDLEAAKLFDQHLYEIYITKVYNKANVDVAKNYYSTASSRLKANNPRTKSRITIPLSIDLEMDGLGGLTVYEGFTVPTDLLPSQYLESGTNKSKVGFFVANLSHNIQNNQWITTIKGNMLPLLDPVLINSKDFGASISNAVAGSPVANVVANTDYDSKFIKTLSSIPVVAYLQGKGYTNGNIPNSELRYLKIPDDNTSNKLHRLFPAAATQWERLVSSARKAGFTVSKLNISYIQAAAYRTLSQQQGGPGRARPGLSPHGWGIAVDIQQLYNASRIAQGIPQGSSQKPIDPIANAKVRQTDPLYKWLAINASTFGFTNPPLLRDNYGTDETWHWEYWGPVNV